MVEITAAEQGRRLRLCGLDPDIYGALVDPSAYTALAIQEAARDGASLPMGVHAGQRLTVRRFPTLGEPLRLTGSVSEPAKIDRGEMIRFAARLEDDRGELVVESTEDLLIPAPSPAPKPKSAPSVAAEPAGFESGIVQFEPTQTAEYCGRDVNPIHFDPAAAASAGFRAPIIGGEQGVRHIMALIRRSRRPEVIDVSLRFLRPLFWDDRCTLLVEASGDHWNCVSLAKQGKKATEVRFHD